MCALTCVWIYEHLFVHACRGQRSTLAVYSQKPSHLPLLIPFFISFFFLYSVYIFSLGPGAQQLSYTSSHQTLEILPIPRIWITIMHLAYYEDPIDQTQVHMLEWQLF